jgi:hypothetical protein
MAVVVNDACIMDVSMGRLVHMHARTIVVHEAWGRPGAVGERERDAGSQHAEQIGQGDTPPGPQSLRSLQSRQHSVRYRSVR